MSGVKRLLEIVSVESLGVIVLDGQEHHIRPLRVSDLGRVEAMRKGESEGRPEALVEFIRLAIPTLDADRICQLELEVVNAIGDIVQRAIAARAAEKEAALRASPLFVGS